jgi:hypothetical protein
MESALPTPAVTFAPPGFDPAVLASLVDAIRLAAEGRSKRDESLRIVDDLVRRLPAEEQRVRIQETMVVFNLRVGDIEAVRVQLDSLRTRNPDSKLGALLGLVLDPSQCPRCGNSGDALVSARRLTRAGQHPDGIHGMIAYLASEGQGHNRDEERREARESIARKESVFRWATCPDGRFFFVVAGTLGMSGGVDETAYCGAEQRPW